MIGIPTYGSNEAAGFNFLVPINTALEFVRQAGAAPQRGAFDKTWTEALDAYSDGKWQSARGLLTDVLSVMPNEPDALRLETMAAQRAQDENIFSSSYGELDGPPGAGSHHLNCRRCRLMA